MPTGAGEGEGGGGQGKFQNTFEKNHDTQHPPKELKVGKQDAYLAQVAARPRRLLPHPPRLAVGSPFCSTLRPGHSRAVRVRGRDKDQRGGARVPACGAGVWGQPGDCLPSLAWQKGDPPSLWREGRGGLSQAETVGAGAAESILFPMDCTQGSGAQNCPPRLEAGSRTPSIPGEKNLARCLP